MVDVVVVVDPDPVGLVPDVDPLDDDDPDVEPVVDVLFLVVVVVFPLPNKSLNKLPIALNIPPANPAPEEPEDDEDDPDEDEEPEDELEEEVDPLPVVAFLPPLIEPIPGKFILIVPDEVPGFLFGFKKSTKLN